MTIVSTHEHQGHSPAQRARRIVLSYAREWEFWVVVALAAVLRFFPASHSPFGSDSAALFLEASRAARDHLLPGAGIYNSVLALNMPLYTYLLLPFAYHPQQWVVVQCALNVATVALFYIFVRRYFGRPAGIVAGLLFATACYDTYMSLFVWQQDFIHPFTVGAFLALYVGVVEERKHWLMPHVLLIGAVIQIHPVTSLLLPLTLLGVAMAWKTITRWDILLSAGGLGILYLPTLLFEYASGYIDLPPYMHYLHAPKHTDLQALQSLSQALGPRPTDWLGSGTLYARISPHFDWLTGMLMVLWLGSALWLLSSAIFPVGAAVIQKDVRALLSLWRSRTWRAYLLLIPWPLLFILSTIRHSSPVYVHYIFVLTPIIYATIGVFLTRIPRQIQHATRFLVARLGILPSHRSTQISQTIHSIPSILITATTAVVIVAQLIVTGAFSYTLASGEAQSYSMGGISAAGYEQTMNLLSSMARRANAGQVWIAEAPDDPFMGMYWAQQQNDLTPLGSGPLWASNATPTCLVSPPMQAHAGLLLVVKSVKYPVSIAVQHEIQQSSTIPMGVVHPARGADYSVYRIQPNTLADSPGLAQIGQDLRFDSMSLASASGSLPRRLVTHWTVSAQAAHGTDVQQYQFHVGFETQEAKVSTVENDCNPSVWVAGEGITVVTAIPNDVSFASLAHIRLAVTRNTHWWYRPHIHSMQFETAKEIESEPTTLRPVIRPSTVGLSLTGQYSDILHIQVSAIARD